jgi:hypothetical protein
VEKSVNYPIIRHLDRRRSFHQKMLVSSLNYCTSPRLVSILKLFFRCDLGQLGHRNDTPREQSRGFGDGDDVIHLPLRPSRTPQKPHQTCQGIPPMFERLSSESLILFLGGSFGVTLAIGDAWSRESAHRLERFARES